MHNRKLDEILAIFGSDLSEKEILRELKKYSEKDVEAAKQIILSGVTAVKDLPSRDTSL